LPKRQKINAIIIINGKIKNISPFIIGKGKGDLLDFEILKDEKGKVFIPATSFIGALKNYMNEKYNYDDKNIWDYFWGSEQNESHFILDDLYLLEDNEEKLVSIRDGIKINSRTGTAEDRMKYNYEVVNKICTFSFNSEIKIFNGIKINDILSILKICIDDLKDGLVCIGAMTSKGFGRFELFDKKILLFKFPDNGLDYLKYLKENKTNSKNLYLNFENIKFNNTKKIDKKPAKIFEIDFHCQIKDSLIIGTYPTDYNESNKVNIKFNGKPTLSGSSIKGVIRSRAIKIINTLSNDGETKVKELFGWIDQSRQNKSKSNQSRQNKYKSKLIVEESIIENAIEEIQTRIKIDRFTGGVITGALAESKPLWHSNENINIKITINDYEDWEAGLILLVIKDLWTSDLPIGGEKSIGKGFLQGISAKIKFYQTDKNEKIIEIKEENGKLSFSNKDDADILENFVEKFKKKLEVK